jgi:hypothetical protein
MNMDEPKMESIPEVQPQSIMPPEVSEAPPAPVSISNLVPSIPVVGEGNEAKSEKANEILEKINTRF